MDYIITKSISRFARNTVDALDCVHELQRLHPPVGIYFERENIDTLNANSEMFLTFYCSMAQEESRSISENIKWSLQKNFRSGKPQINLRRMMGYDKCRDGNWMINKEEAKLVCYIYKRFLEGGSANGIARELNAAGSTTINGKVWRADGILLILRNEKYVGDLIMQKTYTESFLTHKSVKNTGEVPQYFKKNHHPAIVSRDVWNKTQELLLLRQRGKNQHIRKIRTSEGEVEIRSDSRPGNSQEAYAKQAEGKKNSGCTANPFSIMSCASCKEKLKRMSYHAYSKQPFTYGVWRCPGGKGNAADKRKKERGENCQPRTLPEMSIAQSFMEMLYEIKEDVERNGGCAEIVASFERLYDGLCRKARNSGFVEQKIKLMDMEIAELEDNYETARAQLFTASYAASIQIGEHAQGDKNGAYAKLAEDLKEQLARKREERNHLMGDWRTAEAVKQNFEAFLTGVSHLPERHTKELYSLDEYLFRSFILRMEADGDKIRYGTTFGLTLTSVGNSRPIKSFVGYYVAGKDGAMERITKTEQLAVRTIRGTIRRGDSDKQIIG